ncbi:hypothetical protein A2U01_0117321, partial [Trifolium medium]|nr:hypothetical protein [Trifolium medium]
PEDIFPGAHPRGKGASSDAN